MTYSMVRTTVLVNTVCVTDSAWGGTLVLKLNLRSQLPQIGIVPNSVYLAAQVQGGVYIGVHT